MVTPSPASTVAFVCIVLGLVGLLSWGAIHAGRALGEPPRRRRRVGLRTAAALSAWLGLTGALSASSVIRHPGPPPAVVLFLAGSLAVVVGAAFSPFGTRLVRGLPIATLVGAQAFRLPLELVLHAWKEQGVLPVQMTFEGHNFDIVTGTLALGVGAWALRGTLPRPAVWAFNSIGSALLLAVMTIAVLSTPLPIRQYWNEPPVLLAFHFPYGWIVPICVGGALFGHLLVFRWLAWSEPGAQVATPKPPAAARHEV